MVKLTKPQSELLRDVAAGKNHVSTEYPPAKKLVSLGLCVWHYGKFGSSWLELSDVGRAALNEEAGK